MNKLKNHEPFSKKFEQKNKTHEQSLKIWTRLKKWTNLKIMNLFSKFLNKKKIMDNLLKF
jgi:hypothetical protein